MLSCEKLLEGSEPSAEVVKDVVGGRSVEEEMRLELLIILALLVLIEFIHQNNNNSIQYTINS